MPAIKILLTMYMARTMFSVFGSSNGTFLLTCIITRMMTRLVLQFHVSRCSSILVGGEVLYGVRQVRLRGKARSKFCGRKAG